MRLSFVKVTRIHRANIMRRCDNNNDIMTRPKHTHCHVMGRRGAKYIFIYIYLVHMYEWEALGGAARRRTAESAASAAEPERARRHPSAAGPAPPERVRSLARSRIWINSHTRAAHEFQATPFLGNFEAFPASLSLLLPHSCSACGQPAALRSIRT